VLDQMEMISAFTDVLHVPNITKDAQLMRVIQQSNAFTAPDLARLAAKIKGRKSSIGVKKLLGLLDMVKQTDPASRVDKLLSKLEEENLIELMPGQV